MASPSEIRLSYAGGGYGCNMLPTPTRRPAGIALQAGPVAGQGELAAVGARVAFVAFEAGLADFLGQRGLRQQRWAVAWRQASGVRDQIRNRSPAK